MQYKILNKRYEVIDNEHVHILKLKSSNGVINTRGFIFVQDIRFSIGDIVQINFTSKVCPTEFKINLYNRWFDVRLKIFNDQIKYYQYLNKCHVKNILL